MSCVECAVGQYRGGNIMTTHRCLACPSATRVGASNCSDCTPGKYKSASSGSSAGNEACLNCPAGYFTGGAGQSSCQPCGVGRYTHLPPFLECVQCKLGTYVSVNDPRISADVCKSCAAGRYGDESGLTRSDHCKECPSGKWSDEVGQSHKNDCKACPRGWYGTNSANAAGCTQCEAGTYHDIEGQNVMCKDCPRGFYQAESKSGRCEACLSGRHASFSRQIGCRECPAGWSQLAARSAECTKCGAGRYQNNKSQALCLPCVPGTAGTGTGLQRCSACDVNKYTEEPEQQRCTHCPVGFSTSGTKGRAACIACVAGRFMAPGLSTCTACPAGWRRSPTEFNTTKCIACEAGKYQINTAATVCLPCPAGKGAKQHGSHRCTACPAGQYGRQGNCQACPKETYLNETGATSAAECVKCDVRKTTGGRDGCKDESCCECRRGTDDQDRGYYVNKWDLARCDPCPDGANCRISDGATVEQIFPRSGYWRSSPHSFTFVDCSTGLLSSIKNHLAQERCCPRLPMNRSGSNKCDPRADARNSTAAKGDEQCADGYTGVICAGCAPGYVRSGFRCEQCPGGPSMPLAFGFLLGLCAVICAVTVFLLVCSKSSDALGRAQSPVYGQIKIMVSFVQILSSMPSVMTGVPFPSSVLGALLPLQVFNFTVLRFFSFGVCSLSLDFISGTIVHVSLPLMLLMTLVLSYWIANRLSGDKSESARTSRRARVAKALILVVLLLYPGLATRLFTLFKCINIPGEDHLFLEADISVTCYVGNHARLIPIGMAFMALYIGGIPAVMVWVLVRHRVDLHDETRPRHKEVLFKYGGLYYQYEPPFYWFEAAAVVHKMLMTGALCIMGSGVMQPLLGTLLQLFYLLMVLKLAPYESPLDDMSSFAASLSLCLTQLAAIMIKSAELGMMAESAGSYEELTELFGAFIVGFSALTGLFQLVVLCSSTRPGRRCLVRKCGTKRATELLGRAIVQRDSEASKQAKTPGKFPDTSHLRVVPSPPTAAQYRENGLRSWSQAEA